MSAFHAARRTRVVLPMRGLHRVLLLVALAAMPGCGFAPATEPPGERPSPDAGAFDAADDAGTTDAGTTDAGATDANDDAGAIDASDDAGAIDASDDAGAIDASDDAGAIDAGEPDASGDAGASGPDAGWRLPTRPLCATSYRLEAPRARLTGTDLLEVSGVVASPSNPGVLWMHNDSGSDARLFAVGVDGLRLGELLLPQVPAVDLEDIAAAPCPDGSGPCLWVADTGDNGRRRPDAAVHAVPEPAVAPGAPLSGAIAGTTWSFPIVYPDGPVDVEAVFVAPDASAIFLVEKADAAAVRLFRAEVLGGVAGPALEHARFAPPGVAIQRGRLVTGADLHPTARALAIRVYTGTYEYRLTGLAELANLGALGATLVTLGPLTEAQGEAVAYDEAGTGLWTVSEDPRGRGDQPLHHHACQ